jgi:hypothetical protein
MCAVCNFCPICVPKFIVYRPSRIAWDEIKVADSLDIEVAVPEVRLLMLDVTDTLDDFFFATVPQMELTRSVP